MTSILRPDEQAAESEILRAKTRDQTVKKGIKTAVGIGASALGLGLSAKVAPFLSEFIPTDIAMKGISKVSPHLGKFLQKGRSMGLDIKEGLDFIKKQLSPQQEEMKKQPQQSKNIIEEHAPEVHEILVDKIGQGLQPLAAAYQVAKEGKFSKKIAELQKKAGTGFGALVTSIFGGEETKNQPNQQQQAQQQDPRQMAQQKQPQQAQSQQQGNPADTALMSALDKILKM